MGQSDLGLLGLGKFQKNTLNVAKQIEFPDDQRITSVKVGRNHALALTSDGRVYGWGYNNHGQVGYLDPNENQQAKLAGDNNQKPGTKTHNILYDPVLVYPTIEMQKEMEYDNLFDWAKQIEVWEDSSFLVTEDGTLLTWGKNEGGVLGREAKLDVKMMAVGDKRKKLTFSTFVPGRVSKLDKFIVKRMSVREGKVMVYFAEQQDDIAEEEPKDSEVDSEEEKDVVADIEDPNNPLKKKQSTVANQVPLVRRSSTLSQRQGGESTDNKSAKRTASAPQDFASSNENYKKQNTSRSNVSSNSSKVVTHGSRGGGGKKKQDRDMNRYISEILKRAAAIREELNKFDRALADSVKPLTDLNDRNIYYQVIDKFAHGHEKMNDADELRQAIDRM